MGSFRRTVAGSYLIECIVDQTLLHDQSAFPKSYNMSFKKEKGKNYKRQHLSLNGASIFKNMTFFHKIHRIIRTSSEAV